MFDDGIHTATPAEVLKKMKSLNMFLKQQTNVSEVKVDSHNYTNFEVPLLRSRNVFPSMLYLIL